MKAYKATFDFKCINQTYKIGKTYTADKMKICVCGIHFCKNMEDTLFYYFPSKDFKLLEIEVLGNVKFEDRKGVTDKIKVLREIPFEEFPKNMRDRFPVSEYDSNGNEITLTYPGGDVYKYEYDSRGNRIQVTTPRGDIHRYEYDSQNRVVKWTYSDEYTIYEYDSMGNKISEIWPDGSNRWGYDSNGNRISHTDTHERMYHYEYDSNNRLVAYVYPNGDVRRYEYNSNGDIIQTIGPDGSITNYNVAIITESDD